MKLRFTLLLALLPALCHAQNPVLGTAPTAITFACSSVATNSGAECWGGAFYSGVTTPGNDGVLMPFGGFFSKLYVNGVGTVASGYAVTYTIYVGTPGSPSASTVTCQVTLATHACSDLTDSVLVLAGQQAGFQILNPSPTTSTDTNSVGFLFTPLNTTFTCPSITASAEACWVGASASTSTPGDIGGIYPGSGTYSKLFASVATPPPVGEPITVTFYAGTPGSPSATALTCQITSTSSACSDLADTVAITSGEQVSIQIAAPGSTATGTIEVGVQAP